jgi:hypothetical protein
MSADESIARFSTLEGVEYGVRDCSWTLGS